MEQGTGIEPAFTAWEAVVLPIYEPCGYGCIIAKGNGKSNHFLSAVLRTGGGCGKMAASGETILFTMEVRYDRI